MTPTVGQIVHYKSKGLLNDSFAPAIRAAIVTEVVSDTVCHLCVLHPAGMVFRADIEMGTKGGTWSYIPEKESTTTTIKTYQDDIVIHHTKTTDDRRK